MKNSNLSKAKAEKNDEFYTRLEDIEIELSHYPAKYFKDKVIYLPCDVAIEGTKVPKSNFVKYFQINRGILGYKKLIATSINNTKNLYILEQDGTELKGYCPEDSEYVSGDYRSEYCQKLFKEADVVVTNPPFSLFRDFVACLESHSLKYILVGNQNAITYKEIFPLIKENKIWIGSQKGSINMYYKEPYKDELKHFRNTCWFTNMDLAKRHENLLLVKQYNEQDYLKYDNYDAINVDKLKDIPGDYYEVMGVPVTFLYQYNPDQFEILGCPNAKVLPNNYGDGMSQKFVDDYYANGGKATIQKGNRNLVYYDKQGKPIIPYARVLIRRKQQEVQ